jgi:hypothetical protein
MLFLLAGLRIGDDDAALATDEAADFDIAVDTGDFAGVLGLAGFEELGHTRQTTGDVLGLAGLTRRLGDGGTTFDLLVVLDVQGERRQGWCSWR